MKYRSPDSRIVGLVDAATATTIIVFYRRLSHLSLSCYASLPPPRRPIPLRMPIKNLPFGDFTREREDLVSGIVGPTGPESFALLSLSHGGRERKGARLYPGSDGPLRSLPAPGLPKLEIPCRLIPPKFHGAAPQPRKLRGLVYSRACRRALRETAETADIPDEAPIPRQEVCQDTPRGSLLVTLDWRLHS